MKPAKKKAANTADPEWKSLPGSVRKAISTAWVNGMPPLASAVHARWWQLETWLRSLIFRDHG